MFSLALCDDDYEDPLKFQFQKFSYLRQSIGRAILLFFFLYIFRNFSQLKSYEMS